MGSGASKKKKEAAQKKEDHRNANTRKEHPLNTSSKNEHKLEAPAKTVTGLALTNVPNVSPPSKASDDQEELDAFVKVGVLHSQSACISTRIYTFILFNGIFF